MDRNAALHVAIKEDRMDDAQKLLGEAAEIHALTKDGLTPSTLAVQNGHVSLVRLLLD